MAGRFDEIRLDRDEEIGHTVARVGGLLGRGDWVLDIGSGTGRYARAMRGQGMRVVAVDKREHMLQYAPGDLPRICGNGESLPLRSRAFCACTMILVLHQVPAKSRATFLSESLRVLRPGGYLIVKTSSHSDLKRRTFVRFFPTGLLINLARYPTIEDLARIATQAGYEIMDIEGTYSTQLRSVADVMRAIRGRHNSTLALLPDVEFAEGCTLLESELAGPTHFRIEHFHTLLRFRRRDR